MSKVECFYWNKLSNKSFSFESEHLYDLCFVLAVQGGCTDKMQLYHYCVVRQKEFSRKVGMSKVESFYWNQLSNKSFSFQSEQFFDLCFV